MSFVRTDKSLDREGLNGAQRLSARSGLRMACVELELHEWNEKLKRDRLIGCSMTGWQDMVNATGMTMEEQSELLKELRKTVRDAADEYADELV
jgi:ribonucleoside-diphosphate reductase alpha chain/ribonucleoside-triphosphate reductase